MDVTEWDPDEVDMSQWDPDEVDPIAVEVWHQVMDRRLAVAVQQEREDEPDRGRRGSQPALSWRAA
jgi:hypothetical protein